jgi:hypothetical protein
MMNGGIEGENSIESFLSIESPDSKSSENLTALYMGTN